MGNALTVYAPPGTISTAMAIPRRKDRQGARAFGAFVRLVRGQRGKTVRDIGRATGIPHATWSRGERGLVDLRKWDYLIPLAKVLPYPLEALELKADMGPSPFPGLVGVAGAGPSRMVADTRVRPGTVSVVAVTASLLEDLGAALPEFEEAMTALVHDSYKKGDPALMREVTAYARGLLARKSDLRRR